jgi:PAS domain S-box-containing protein
MSKDETVQTLVKEASVEKEKREHSRKNEVNLESIFVSLPSAITVSDLNGNIVECNHATLDMHGFSSKEELIGKSALELIAKKDHQRAIENLKKTLEQSSVKSVEYTFLTKDGREFPAELSASVMKDSSGKPIGFVAITKNIIEHKQIEEAFRQSESRYRTIFEGANEGILGVNPETTRFVFANPAICSLTGYSENDLLKLEVADIHPKEHLPYVMEQFKKLAQEKMTFAADIPVQRKDKSVIYCDINVTHLKIGKQNLMAGFFRDITERKRAEDALKEKEERFRDIEDNTGDWIWEADPEGKYTYVSPIVEQLLGYKPEEVLGKYFYDFFVPEEKEQLKEATFDVFSDRGHFKGFVNRVIHKNGRIVILETSGVPRFGNDRQFLGYRGVDHDVTESKMLEESLSALNFYGGMLSSAKNLVQIYELALDAMQQLLGFEYVAFATANRGVLRLVFQRGYSVPINFELPLDGTKGGIMVKAARVRAPIIAYDVSEDEDYFEVTPSIRSKIAVPIIADDKVVGVLSAESKKLGAFEQKHEMMLQVLAWHVAAAMNNIRNLEDIEKHSKDLSSLINNSTEMIRSRDLDEQLKTIAKAITDVGWRKVTVAVGNKIVEMTHSGDNVSVFVADEDNDLLDKPVSAVWKEFFGPKFDQFKIGEFYYLPWNESSVRKNFSKNDVLDKRISEDEEWSPKDVLYAPLRLSDGYVMGMICMEEPVDGKRPSKESLARLELFLHQTAVVMTNTQLVQQLIESEQRYKDLFESASDAIFIMDFDSRIIEVNRVACERLGYTREELVQMTLKDIDAYKISIMPEVIKNPQQQSQFLFETAHVRRDGTIIPIEVSGRIINYVGIPAVLSIARDITERKQMLKKLEEYSKHLEVLVEKRTEQLKQTQDQLLKAERLAAIGEVASMVGHDLRNPLSGIAGATYYLKKKLNTETPSKTREMLDIIEKNIEYSDRIVNDLLDYSRQIRLTRREVALKSVIQESVSLASVPQNIEVLDLTQNEPKINIDADMIKRVFVNIIKNAAEAMPNGGKLTIKSRESGDNVEIAFSDNGVGIPKEIMEKLFTPLFTTKAKGMGLGLAICKRVVEAHSGHIRVESTVNEGTTFTVIVPIAPKVDGGEKNWMSKSESLSPTMMKA